MFIDQRLDIFEVLKNGRHSLVVQFKMNNLESLKNKENVI